MNEPPRRIVVAVTGASGALYARLTVEALLRQPRVEALALIYTPNGRRVAEYEGELPPVADPRVRVWEDHDLFAPVASGSSRYDAMAVVPCSMGTAARIAAGVSLDLVSRAADVMLKERRRLVLVVRETPLSALHLENLGRLAHYGAVVLPACPSFYHRAEGVEALCGTVVERTLVHLGFDDPERAVWGEPHGA